MQFFHVHTSTRTIKANHCTANMKHDLITGWRKTENLSRAAATGKVLSNYDVISKIGQHLQGTNLRFNNLLVLNKCKRQKKIFLGS